MNYFFAVCLIFTQLYTWLQFASRFFATTFTFFSLGCGSSLGQMKVKQRFTHTMRILNYHPQRYCMLAS